MASKKMRNNDDFVRLVNEGKITLEKYSDRYKEGYIEGLDQSIEYVHYALYTAALQAAAKQYILDDKGIYSLFLAIKEEIDQNLDTREKIQQCWEKMRETLDRMGNDIPDPVMEPVEIPDGNDY